jgi:hypothetical protein
MKIADLFESSVLPDNVLSYQVGKFFASTVTAIPGKLGTKTLGTVHRVVVSPNDCYLSVYVRFSTDEVGVSRHVAHRKFTLMTIASLVKPFKLDPKDYRMGVRRPDFSDDLPGNAIEFEIFVTKIAEFPVDVEKLKAGFDSIGLPKKIKVEWT